VLFKTGPARTRLPQPFLCKRQNHTSHLKFKPSGKRARPPGAWATFFESIMSSHFCTAASCWTRVYTEHYKEYKEAPWYIYSHYFMLYARTYSLSFSLARSMTKVLASLLHGILPVVYEEPSNWIRTIKNNSFREKVSVPEKEKRQIKRKEQFRGTRASGITFMFYALF
jgi:hypothetical protein